MVKKRSPRVKDPVMEIKDLQLSKDAWAGMYNMHDVGMILCGLFLIIGFLGTWVSFNDGGKFVELDGFHFARDAGTGPLYPAVWFVPLIGGLLIIRPIFAAYQRRSTYLPVWPMAPISLVLCAIAMVVPLLVANSHSAVMLKALKITFWNNAGAGFYLTVGAAFGGVFVGLIALIEGFISKGAAQKALQQRGMKFGMSAYPAAGGDQGAMAPSAPAPVAQGGWDQAQQGGYQAPGGWDPAQQQGYAQGPPPGSPFGPRPTDPKAAEKYDKAVAAWMAKQQKGGGF